MVIMATLYELTEEYQRLIDLIEEDDLIEIDSTTMAILDSIESSIDDKFAAICRVIRELEHKSAACKAESDRLQTKSRSASNQVDRLKDYMQATMETLGEKSRKIDELFTVAIQASPAAVEILDMDSVPHEFDRPIERQIDKTRIKDALKKGVEVPGCSLVQSTHLRIR